MQAHTHAHTGTPGTEQQASEHTSIFAQTHSRAPSSSHKHTHTPHPPPSQLGSHTRGKRKVAELQGVIALAAKVEAARAAALKKAAAEKAGVAAEKPKA